MIRLDLLVRLAAHVPGHASKQQIRQPCFAAIAALGVIGTVNLVRKLYRPEVKLEQVPFGVPALRLTDFMAGTISESLPQSSYPFPLVPASLDDVLPEEVISAILVGLPAAGHRVTQALPVALEAYDTD